MIPGHQSGAAMRHHRALTTIAKQRGYETSVAAYLLVAISVAELTNLRVDSEHLERWAAFHPSAVRRGLSELGRKGYVYPGVRGERTWLRVTSSGGDEAMRFMAAWTREEQRLDDRARGVKVMGPDTP